MVNRLKIVALIGIVALAVAAAATSRRARAEDNPLPTATTHLAFDSFVALVEGADGAPGEAAFKNPPNPICSTSTSTAANVSTDCEAVAPHNETSIAVNPTNPFNMIGGANDYQLKLSAGGTVNETVFSRAHVTFDGGATWTSAAVVAKGTGSFGSKGTFNDKEYIAAWGSGNAIVTYTKFRDGIRGSYGGSPIFASVTHDGGATWSAPVEISGSAPFCVGVFGDTTCDQNQGSVPAVAANGAIYVA